MRSRVFRTALFLLSFCHLIVAGAEAEIPVFPGAVGSGAYTLAGSGRNQSPVKSELFIVSSLTNSGPGSLRDCVEAEGPRVCAFEVSGEIALKKDLKITNPFISIAGQTAPSGGVRLSGAGLVVETHDVLLQHLEIRVGDLLVGPAAGGRDGLRIGAENREAYNVMVDHVSVSWAIDENGSTAGAVWATTISNSIFAESLNNSIHPKGAHSKGFMVGDGANEISFVSNILSKNHERNPYLKPGVKVQFLNNIVYGWGGSSKTALLNFSDISKTNKPVRLDFAGNNFIKPTICAL